ncbi:MAG TPA: PEGA domain-containing protein [Kofleriaceae bacterium]|nr:PEGA domain-containing protein [Kofleriaceae bacterium]
MLATAAPAWAGKPSIAVLGLEVVDPGGTPTPADTQVAKDLTEGLRSRAKAGTGAYSLAPGSEKELIDLKLLNNCDSAAPSCMSVIGANLGADFLMYGKIEKEKSGKAYTVSMFLLDVKKKAVEHTSNALIPLAQASGPSLTSWAKNIYGNLTGQQSSGIVVVKLTNADHGTILIDNEAKGSITNGVGQVSGLEEGKYKLGVESEGFKRAEQDITVRAGETQNIPVKLEKAEGGGEVTPVGPGGGGVIVGGGGGGGGESSRGWAGWKPVFFGSVAVGLAAGAWWIHAAGKVTDYEMEECENGYYGGTTSPASPVNCTGKSNTHMTDEASLRAAGNHWSTQTYIAGTVVGLAGALAIVAGYEGFIAKRSSSSSEHAMGHRVHRDRFVVTPIVSPNGGAVTMQLTW